MHIIRANLIVALYACRRVLDDPETTTEKRDGALAQAKDALHEYEQHMANPERCDMIECAQVKYIHDDSIEVDDDALLSPADDGSVWVQAWIRLTAEECKR